MDLNRPWKDATFIAIDTETTGKYPLEAELCEIAAVKWHQGQVIDEFQTLLKPTRPMDEEVIKIHHITNEMVASAPCVSEKINDFYEFIRDGVCIAHHAPFDLGFLSIAFEERDLALPSHPALCTSLLSRKAFPGSTNHRLQTLIKYLNVPQGQAHRALDDSRACLAVALKCFRKIGEQCSTRDLLSYQEVGLSWQNYSIKDLRAHPVYSVLVKALREGVPLQIVYQGGSRRGQARMVYPIGLVRNPQDDFFIARDENSDVPKRYFLKRISRATL